MVVSKFLDCERSFLFIETKTALLVQTGCPELNLSFSVCHKTKPKCSNNNSHIYNKFGNVAWPHVNVPQFSRNNPLCNQFHIKTELKLGFPRSCCKSMILNLRQDHPQRL